MHDIWDIAFLILAIIIFIVNTIEVKLILKERKGLSIFEKMLLSMAAADLLIGIGQGVISALRMSHTKVRGFKFNTILFLTVAVSFNHVNAITVDRFLAVCWPLKHKIWVTKKVVNISIVILWVANAGFLVPLFVKDSMDYIRYILAIIVISYLALMSFIYAVIVYKAIICRRRSFQSQSSTTADQAKKDFQLVMLSITIVVTFAVCTVPFCIQAFISEEIAKPFKFCLVLNSFFNPFIYFFWKYAERKSRKQASTST